jgi:hypothetical protein
MLFGQIVSPFTIRKDPDHAIVRIIGRIADCKEQGFEWIGSRIKQASWKPVMLTQDPNVSAFHWLSGEIRVTESEELVDDVIVKSAPVPVSLDDRRMSSNSW